MLIHHFKAVGLLERATQSHPSRSQRSARLATYTGTDARPEIIILIGESTATRDAASKEAVLMLYTREANDAGEWAPWVSHSSTGDDSAGSSGSRGGTSELDPFYGMSLDEFTTFEYVGERVVPGTNTKYFRATYEHADGTDPEYVDKREFCVGFNGVPVKTTETVFLQGEWITSVTTYFGWGETNIITSPSESITDPQGPTPTPTATPTSTPVPAPTPTPVATADA